MRTLAINILIFMAATSFGQSSATFGELVHATDLGSLTPTPDRTIVGVQYAAGSLWATGFDPDDYWQHKLYKFNEDGTVLLDVFSYGIEAAGWKDMAYDGDYLYVTDMDTIRQLDLGTGEKTGVTIPAPFYYNSGLAYNPLNDHFYVSGDGGSNIYEIDREGTIISAIDDYANHATVGLAVDTLSVGGPFLWTWSNESIGYNLSIKACQVSLVTHAFTGIEFDGESISAVISETAGGATISYDVRPDSLTFIGINTRNGNANDQMEYAMFYDITNDELPGPQIYVDPTMIQNILPPGDSVDVMVTLANGGNAPLYWSAYIETPEQDTLNSLGDLLASFNATVQSQNDDKGMNGITFLNDKLWVNGRNYGSDQSVVYEFNKQGELLASHGYYALSPLGFRSITSDGEYLYGEDTYSINQIDPESFSTVGYILKPSGSFQGMTYDPQKDHFWGGNSVGLIIEFDRDGNEINEFITDYSIHGLAWDQWSPGGPFLWAWIETNDENGSGIEALRLDPNTCTPSGEGFLPQYFSDDPFSPDQPEDIVITNQWEPNKVTLLGLQNTTVIEGSDTLSNHDFVATYDLDVTPPPEWIGLIDTSFGTIPTGNTGQFMVRLRSIMDDTVMTAVVRINSNDILNPEVLIPVNFEMTASITGTAVAEEKEKLSLGQNYPNPAGENTVIPITLDHEQEVRLDVYSITGEHILSLFQGRLSGGNHKISLDVNGLTRGLYFYSLRTSREVLTKRMIIKN
jgi:hypothetical protein